MSKSLETKLTVLRRNPNSKAFIIAYAADADMSRGVLTTGEYYPPRSDEESRPLSMQAYYEQLEAMVEQANIDILLTSVSSMDVLAHQQRLFEDSSVTPAVRANDTSDIWRTRGATYAGFPSRPFATTTIEEAQFGTLLPEAGQKLAVNLGLYSVTFNNDLEADWQTLSAFKVFRVEAAQKGFKYFLEVFNPNVAYCGMDPAQIPHYVNDQIARMLAGIPRPSRPQFLKIAYNGPEAMEALVNYDSTMIVGILGGGASTTYDSFKLLIEAKKYGAKVALFGRRIKEAEHPLSFVKILRQVADETISPEEGVKAYHGELQQLDIPPRRGLEADMVVETAAIK